MPDIHPAWLKDEAIYGNQREVRAIFKSVEASIVNFRDVTSKAVPLFCRRHTGIDPDERAGCYFENRTIEGAPILIDEVTFQNCEFKNCVLITTGTQAEFIDCSFDESCKLLLLGPAKATVDVLAKFKTTPGGQSLLEALVAGPTA